jgi:uncharacterized membrane protein YeaQ/YmgE (transglycosylase-associated protein family)
VQLKAEEVSALFELMGVASLCGWTVCLVVGLGFCSPDRALLVGVPGTVLGGLLFRLFGWPEGPIVAGYPILPALLGTTMMLGASAYVSRLLEELQPPREEDPLRRFRVWPDAPRWPDEAPIACDCHSDFGDGSPDGGKPPSSGGGCGSRTAA